MIKDHPLFGVGLGEWKIHFPKYGMGAAPYMNSGMIRFEKPHNDFILTCCETGIPGLICYLALFIVSFIYCKRILTIVQSPNDKLLIRLVAAALFAFVIISMFGYPNQRPYTMIFFMLILAIIQSKYLQVFPVNENTNTKKYYTLLFISGILISAFGLSIGIKRMKAEIHLSNALVAQKYKNWGIMIRESTLAECNYFPMDFTSTPVSWYRGFANFYSGNTDEAFLNFQKAGKINPYHFNLLNDLGTCYDFKQNPEMAKSYYQRANKIAPSFPDAIINLSVIYYNAGNIDSAYYLISKDNLIGNPSYIKDLKVILFAKAQKIVSQVSDPAAKAFLTEKIADEKWLLALQEETKKTHQTLEQLLRSQHIP
jgi:tetratricopeptide (TPR) repeat protein